jgi:hypothetical protein
MTAMKGFPSSEIVEMRTYLSVNYLFDNDETDLTKLAHIINLKPQPEEIQQTFNI